MKNLLFIHIPKTAGTTMMTALKNTYGSGLYRIDNKVNQDPCWSEGLPSYARCVTGHMSYYTAQKLRFNADAVIFARDPLDRVPSLYNYIHRRGKRHSAYKHAKNRTLAQFVADRKIAGVNDGMVRYLSSLSIGIRPFDQPVTESDYWEARENLEKMAFVGLTDRFDESLGRMAELLEWAGTPAYKKLLVNHKKRGLTEQEETIIMAFNQYDSLLYQDAIEMFWS